MAEQGHSMPVSTEKALGNLNGDQLGPGCAFEERGAGRRHMYTRLGGSRCSKFLESLTGQQSTTIKWAKQGSVQNASRTDHRFRPQAPSVPDAVAK